MLHMLKPDDIFYITISVLAIVWIISLIIVLIHRKRLRNTIDDQSNIIYVLLKRIQEVQNDLTEMQRNIESLSTSIELMNSHVKRNANETLYPDPKLAEMITSTIKEQLTIELTLSKNMTLANRESVTRITKNVARTYPQVDKEYIVKKCLAVIESVLSKQ